MNIPEIGLFDSDVTINDSLYENLLVSDTMLASMTHQESYLDNQCANCPYDWYSSAHVAGAYSESEYLNFLLKTMF